MFSGDDTIVAIATPPGRGGLGIVRISGPDASRIAQVLLDRTEPLSPRSATLSRIVSPRHRARPLDQVIVTFFPAPASYTGQAVVEISAHGSPVVLREILKAAMHAGARLAEPGEFTLRAFLSGRMDLVQAEAVADLIDAVTPLQARAAFDQLNGTLTTTIGDIDRRLFDLIARLEASIDFPDEGFHFVTREQVRQELTAIAGQVSTLLADARRGRMIREGLQVVIAGKPNVGKSSLFNALLGAPRAIVTDQPGTTRDLVGDLAEMDGIRVHLVDSAGIQDTVDVVEAEGVARARQALSVANLVLLVLDRSRPLDRSDEQLLSATLSSARLIVVNKIDLPPAWSTDRLATDDRAISVSVETGDGIHAIAPLVSAIVGGCENVNDSPAITNIRHIDLMKRADESIRHALAATTATSPLSEEFILADLQDSRAAFEEITGRRTPDDVLRHIFERFCIGK